MLFLYMYMYFTRICLCTLEKKVLLAGLAQDPHSEELGKEFLALSAYAWCFRFEIRTHQI